MKRGRVPRFGATQWTHHDVAVALEALDVC
jgi:hypothetical protein